jgi:hypothetical protein
VWVLRELKKKKKRRRKIWVHPVICDRRNKGLFWYICEDIKREEARLFTYFRMSVNCFEEPCETTEYSVK